MSLYNKSDKKSTKISKIYLACVPADELKNQLLSTGKPLLQCKSDKLVKASLLKIILDPNTPHSTLPLFKNHSKFQQRFSKRGVTIPELSDALGFYEELDGIANAFKNLSCAVTSTPRVQTRVKTSCFSPVPVLQRGFLCKIRVCFINLNYIVFSYLFFIEADSYLKFWCE